MKTACFGLCIEFQNITVALLVNEISLNVLPLILFWFHHFFGDMESASIQDYCSLMPKSFTYSGRVVFIGAFI